MTAEASRRCREARGPRRFHVAGLWERGSPNGPTLTEPRRTPDRTLAGPRAGNVACPPAWLPAHAALASPASRAGWQLAKDPVMRPWFRSIRLFLPLVFALLAGAAHAEQFKVLVLSKTNGWHHDSIPAAVAGIRQLGLFFE